LSRHQSQQVDIERWRSDPVAFAVECFGITAWEKQAELLRAIAVHHRVACRSGHKVSKTVSAGILAYWWALTRPGAKVILTSSSYRQVRDILWYEVTALAQRARKIGKLELPPVAAAPETGIRWDDGRFIKGFSTDDPVRMGGFSGPAMLFIVDEASGVDERIFEAIRGNLAGGTADDESAVAKLFLVGNPTQVSGTFYEAFHKQRKLWDTHHISSADTPNVKEGRVVIPGLATQEYLDECLVAYKSKDDPRYQVRVAGNFPQQNAFSVIKLGAVEAAIERYANEEWRRAVQEPNKYRLHVGVDVARFGDDSSVACPRRGPVAFPSVRCSKLDEVEVSGMVINLCYGPEGLHRKGEQKPLVKVDVIGVGGGVATILKRATNDDGDLLFNVVEVNVSEKALEDGDYPNQRSEMWFATAEWLETGAVPDTDDLHSELIAPRYKFDGQGRRCVERKAEFKKRLGHSPDEADALCLSVYTPEAIDDPGIHVPTELLPEGYRFGGQRGFG
jgi:hypothetical protein